jgi:hypothetical protein
MSTSQPNDRSLPRLIRQTRSLGRSTTVRRVSSALLVAAVLILAACEGQSSQDAVRETATAYAKALADGDAKEACDLMSREAQIQIVAARTPAGGHDCPTTMRNVARSLDDSVRRALRDYKVTNVVINGDRARVEGDGVLGPGSRPYVKQGDRWLVAGPDKARQPR